MRMFALVAAAVFLAGAGIDSHFRVRRERGELAAASITGTNLGTANTILTTTKDSVMIAADTDCTVGFMLTKDGEDFKRIFAGKGIVFDLNGDGIALGPGTYKLYYTGSSPSACTVEIVAFPYR